MKRELEACEAKAAEYEQEAFSLRGSLTAKDDELAQLRDDLKDCRESEDSLLAQLDAEERRKAEIRKAVSAGPNWEAFLDQAEQSTEPVSTNKNDATSLPNRSMRNMIVSLVLKYRTLSKEAFKRRLYTALSGIVTLAVGAVFVAKLVDWATESREIVLTNADAWAAISSRELALVNRGCPFWTSSPFRTGTIVPDDCGPASRASDACERGGGRDVVRLGLPWGESRVRPRGRFPVHHDHRSVHQRRKPP